MKRMNATKYNLFVLAITCFLLVGCETTFMEPIQSGTLTIEFDLYEDAIVTLTIENCYSAVIVFLFNHVECFSGSNAVTWDCRDEHGKEVIDGIYFIRLIIEDSKGKSETIRKIILTNP